MLQEAKNSQFCGCGFLLLSLSQLTWALHRLPNTEGLDYSYWRKIAMDLAKHSPDEVIQMLEVNDPFQVRTFERKLLKHESQKGGALTDAELKTLFPCPQQRISYPDQRDHSRKNAFKNGAATYLFFQHLRKAGGTNFCSLALKNLPDHTCSPDEDWSSSIPPACLLKRTNDEIDSKMHQGGHHIIANEWDHFDPERFFDLDAIYATTFRRPLDRALSQFRFECLEGRGCIAPNISEFWQSAQVLHNVYTATFANLPQQEVVNMYKGDTPHEQSRRGLALGKALDTLARFNLVLVMEWLVYAAKPVEHVLGFKETSELSHRVRPFIEQAARKDGQYINLLGAAGIMNSSWSPKGLSKAQSKAMKEDLALDEILTDAARRFFLERLVCNAY